jgi:hypothetical protein
VVDTSHKLIGVMESMKNPGEGVESFIAGVLLTSACSTCQREKV